jgi:Flp pilus assembly protein TadG
VEFAVVAPVLFALLLGMVEFGRAIMVQQVLTNASREGCRQAVLDGATSGGVTSTVTTYLSSAGISGSTVTITPTNPSSAGYGAPVTVSVTLPFNQVSWLGTPIFLNGKSLAATTVMRRETVQ